MRKLIITILFLIPICGNAQSEIEQLVVDQINIVRANPTKYFQSIDTTFSDYTAQPSLQYNDSLSTQARDYAYKLSQKQRLVHSRGNYAESISIDSYPDYIVYKFIIESGADQGETGHRDHLLSKNNAHTQIGVGIVKAKYEDRDCYYVVIRTI